MEKNENRFKVNLAGMIDILSNHLYNNKDVYIRELLQNATDAIRARKLEYPNFSEMIHISLLNQPTNKRHTIIIEDNGIGLSKEDFHQFIATIAHSSKGTKNFSEKQNFIGRFGIGLLSCFIIADEIVIVSTSAKTKECFEWRGRSDGTYSIRQLATPFDEPGTKIYLITRPTDHLEEELLEQLEPENLAETLFKYGACLEVPIYFTANGREEVINKDTRGIGMDDTLFSMPHETILELGEALLKETFQDYFFIQSKNGQTKGIAYIIPYTTKINAQKRNTVYLNQMFVSSQVEAILPEWAFFTRCILWTDELQPVASREDFYHDKHLQKIARELGSSLKLGIESLPTESLKKLITAHYLSFKSLASEDIEFLKMIYTFLPFRTLNGEEIFADILTQNTTIHYALSVDDFRQMSDLARTQGFTVINGGYSYDRQLLAHISTILADFPFNQLKVLQPEDFQQIFHPLTFSESNDLVEIVEEINQDFQELNLMILLKHFDPVDMPMILLSNHSTLTQRELERTAEESNDLFSGILEDLMIEPTHLPQAKLYLNMDNSLIQRLFNGKQNRLAVKNTIEVLYIQALLLGHYPLKKKELALLNTSLISLLDQLI